MEVRECAQETQLHPLHHADAQNSGGEGRTAEPHRKGQGKGEPKEKGEQGQQEVEERTITHKSYFQKKYGYL